VTLIIYLQVCKALLNHFQEVELDGLRYDPLVLFPSLMHIFSFNFLVKSYLRNFRGKRVNLEGSFRFSFTYRAVVFFNLVNINNYTIAAE
jgi:hypothetical protein